MCCGYLVAADFAARGLGNNAFTFNSLNQEVRHWRVARNDAKMSID